jgi:hypothetical protein
MWETFQCVGSIPTPGGDEMLAATSNWATVLGGVVPFLFLLLLLFLFSRFGFRDQRRLMERNKVFMDRQEQLLERIAVALEARAEKGWK